MRDSTPAAGHIATFTSLPQCAPARSTYGLLCRKGIMMKIDHIALYVKDLEQSRIFFETYFHATSNTKYHNQTTGFESYFLTFDDHTRLELMTRPGVSDRDPASFPQGYAHLAFHTGSRQAVDTLTAHLKADGYRLISGPRTTGDGYYESCIEDGEGNLIELTI